MIHYTKNCTIDINLIFILSFFFQLLTIRITGKRRNLNTTFVQNYFLYYLLACLYQQHVYDVLRSVFVVPSLCVPSVEFYPSQLKWWSICIQMIMKHISIGVDQSISEPNESISWPQNDLLSYYTWTIINYSSVCITSLI